MNEENLMSARIYGSEKLQLSISQPFWELASFFSLMSLAYSSSIFLFSFLGLLILFWL